MKKDTPTMAVSSVHATAMTYYLRPDDHSGWGALCTVNDRTGELAITSDWGNWSHMWSANPKHLGCPTLTDFIGDRNAVDYLASKLNMGNGPRSGTEFDAEETGKAFIRILARWRLECGREVIELARDNEESCEETETRLEGTDPNRFYRSKMDRDPLYRSEAKRFLTKAVARRIADEIKDLAYDCSRSSELYVERFYQLIERNDVSPLFPDAYEDVVYTQSYPDRILRESILPPLIEACRQTSIARALVAANGPQAFPEAA